MSCVAARTPDERRRMVAGVCRLVRGGSAGLSPGPCALWCTLPGLTHFPVWSWVKRGNTGPAWRCLVCVLAPAWEVRLWRPGHPCVFASGTSDCGLCAHVVPASPGRPGVSSASVGRNLDVLSLASRRTKACSCVFTPCRALVRADHAVSTVHKVLCGLSPAAALVLCGCAAAGGRRARFPRTGSCVFCLARCCSCVLRAGRLSCVAARKVGTAPTCPDWRPGQRLVAGSVRYSGADAADFVTQDLAEMPGDCSFELL